MDIGSGKERASGLDKTVDELVVPLSTNSLLAKPEVQVIVEQILVVCAAIKHDREGPVRVDPGTERGENKLRHRDKDTPCTLISDSEDFFTIYSTVNRLCLIWA